MAEKMSEVYDAYEVNCYQTMRSRGAINLRTDKGVMQLKTPEINESRLEAEHIFKEKLYECGFSNIDRCIRNKDGELATFDRYGTPFVMRRFYEGRECNIYDEAEIMYAVKNLAKLHIACKQVFDTTESDVHIRVDGDFRKRNRELKRIDNFILHKKGRKEFEDMYHKAYPYFYEQAKECENLYGELMTQNMDTRLGYCHGMYDHHSLIVYENMDGTTDMATINFDRFYVGNQMADLYHFMRKTVEKNGYSFELLLKILNNYSAINPLQPSDIEYIYILYSYPEKFYKLGNQYMNSSKNRISPKMNEKLERIIGEEEQKKELLLKIYNYKNRLK